MQKALIIAEAGVNHNGSEDLAFQLVDAAVKAGADVVKFQTFKAKNLVTSRAAQAAYQVENIGSRASQLEMLSRLELSYETHHRLFQHCKDNNIEFLSTAFDSHSLNFLVNELNLRRLKIPSGEITNAPLLLAHARTGRNLIVSTGMCDLSDIEMALGVIAFGYIAEESAQPSVSAFRSAYASCLGQEALREKVSLLHCTTEYPAPLTEVNLRAMDTLGQAFAVPIGYSDHTAGISIPLAAVARGATLIEKHFTLDRNMAGPDHKASLEPDELHEMVCGIRAVEVALGSTKKVPTASEIKNREFARKSLVASEIIKRGETYTSKNVSSLRPGLGISPLRYWEYMGKKAQRDYSVGDTIEE